MRKGFFFKRLSFHSPYVRHKRHAHKLQLQKKNWITYLTMLITTEAHTRNFLNCKLLLKQKRTTMKKLQLSTGGKRRVFSKFNLTFYNVAQLKN